MVGKHHMHVRYPAQRAALKSDAWRAPPSCHCDAGLPLNEREAAACDQLQCLIGLRLPGPIGRVLPPILRVPAESRPEGSGRNHGRLRASTHPACPLLLCPSASKYRMRTVLHAPQPALPQAAFESASKPITMWAQSAHIPSSSWACTVVSTHDDRRYCKTMRPCAVSARGRAEKLPALRASAPGLLAASAARTKICIR